MQVTGVKITIEGIVQGVGFRPFIHRLVDEFLLSGYIRNTANGVEMEVEGTAEKIEGFLAALQNDPPRPALIEKICVEEYQPLRNYPDFRIEASRSGAFRDTLVSPDIGICDDCLNELFDPADRRYRYPFINCTNCGPRFTIVKDIPYDREKTTMADFAMCEQCSREYADIDDRRYHAQPDCCPDCGPEVFFVEKTAAMQAGAAKDHRADAMQAGDGAVSKAIRYLAEGKIIAVKGLGGFHLACRIDDEQLIQKLRQRKQRDEKPFAVMAADINAVKELCKINEAEEKLLMDPKRPIVLLQKKNPDAYQYISENTDLGIMLPYTPLHYLLFAGLRDAEDFLEEAGSRTDESPQYKSGGVFGEVNALIMTSANLADEPVIYENDEALSQLAEIADGFLLHNRPIETRCDDSLIRVFEGQEYPVRRSRGYVPYPVRLPEINKGKSSILACGAEQKASFALTKGDHIFLSQHIGDLKNLPTLKHYEQQIRHFERLFSIRPEIFSCDLHPDYLSSEYAGRRGEQAAADAGLSGNTNAADGPQARILFRVQHHHAHMAACMADNGLTQSCIGIIWDGTGAGARAAARKEERIDYMKGNPVPDGTIWGGEFLVGDYSGFRRAGSLLPFRLPGGDKAAKELWRTAISLALESGQLLLEKQPDPQSDCNMPADVFQALFPDKPVEQILSMLEHDLNCPVCTSMGRLFDGVAGLLGICDQAGYEGQGAVLLEACGSKAADCSDDDCFSYSILKEDIYRFDYRSMIEELLRSAPQTLSEQERNRLARRFMNTMVDMATEMTKQIAEECNLYKVVLSGGSFQNRYMLRRLVNRLRGAGFEVYYHKQIAPNDEGIAVGQAMVAKAAFFTC